MSVYFYSVCVVLCVGRGLGTGWSPIHGALSYIGLRNWKCGQGQRNGHRIIKIIIIMKSHRMTALQLIMNWKGSGRERSWHDLRHYNDYLPGILRRETKHFSSTVDFPPQIPAESPPNMPATLQLARASSTRFMQCFFRYFGMMRTTISSAEPPKYHISLKSVQLSEVLHWERELCFDLIRTFTLGKQNIKASYLRLPWCLLWNVTCNLAKSQQISEGNITSILRPKE
jgi:hypothetical protein